MFSNRSRTNRAEHAGAPARGRQHSGTVPKQADPDREARCAALADQVMRAIAGRRYGDATTRLLDLIAMEPDEPRWHQKYGEVLRTLGRNREAAAAYRRAARRYEVHGLPVRASAALRVADTLDGVPSTTPAVQRTSDRNATRPVLQSEDNSTAGTVRPPPGDTGEGL